jgi:hypothetical protein
MNNVNRHSSYKSQDRDISNNNKQNNMDSKACVSQRDVDLSVNNYQQQLMAKTVAMFPSLFMQPNLTNSQMSTQSMTPSFSNLPLFDQNGLFTSSINMNQSNFSSFPEQNAMSGLENNVWLKMLDDMKKQQSEANKKVPFSSQSSLSPSQPRYKASAFSNFNKINANSQQSSSYNLEPKSRIEKRSLQHTHTKQMNQQPPQNLARMKQSSNNQEKNDFSSQSIARHNSKNDYSHSNKTINEENTLSQSEINSNKKNEQQFSSKSISKSKQNSQMSNQATSSAFSINDLISSSTSSASTPKSTEPAVVSSQSNQQQKIDQLQNITSFMSSFNMADITSFYNMLNQFSTGLAKTSQAAPISPQSTPYQQNNLFNNQAGNMLPGSIDWLFQSVPASQSLSLLPFILKQFQNVKESTGSSESTTDSAIINDSIARSHSYSQATKISDEPQTHFNLATTLGCSQSQSLLEKTALNIYGSLDNHSKEVNDSLKIPSLASLKEQKLHKEQNLKIAEKPIENNTGFHQVTCNKSNGQHPETMTEIFEAKIKLPLKYGWKRETIVKELHRNGVKGDVIYYSPCGRRLRSFQEIERYLSSHPEFLTISTNNEYNASNVKLSRDNFTFSSKLIVGSYLLPKNKDLESNEDIKYLTLNEEQLTTKLKQLNPRLKKHSSAYASNIDETHILQKAASSSLITSSDDRPINKASYEPNNDYSKCEPLDLSCTSANVKSANRLHTSLIGSSSNSTSTVSSSASPSHSLDLKDKIESLKRLKQENERLLRSQQAQMQMQQFIQQQQLEQQLNKQFETNSKEIKLQLSINTNDSNSSLLNLQQQQQQYQLHQQELIEAHRKEKLIEQERRTREKWLEYIVAREQHALANPLAAPLATNILGIAFNSQNKAWSSEPIDDLQEKVLKVMPNFEELHINNHSYLVDENSSSSSLFSLDWMADSLQVIEFVKTFGERLKKCAEISSSSIVSLTTNINTNHNQVSSSISEIGATSNDSVLVNSENSSILDSLEAFRLGLENKSEKYKREIIQLTFMLIKSAISALDDDSSENESDENSEEEDSEDDDDSADEKFENSKSNETKQSLENTKTQSISLVIEDNKTQTKIDDPSPTEQNSNYNNIDKIKNEKSNIFQSSESANNLQQQHHHYLDHYYMNKLEKLECNESSYSELIRLYMRRSLINLRRRRQLFKFDIDVTRDLYERLVLLTNMLENNTFDMLAPSYKASIMAFLCDELLNSSVNDFEFDLSQMNRQEKQKSEQFNQNDELSNNNNNENNNMVFDEGTENVNSQKLNDSSLVLPLSELNMLDERRVSMIAAELDSTIDELNDLKKEKWSIETKLRSLKMEKITTNMTLNKLRVDIARLTGSESSLPSVLNQFTLTDNSSSSVINSIESMDQAHRDEQLELKRKESDKQQKSMVQLEKKISQLEKRRFQIKTDYDQMSGKLRSGIHLGFDRFVRSYWQLTNTGGVLVEALSLPIDPTNRSAEFSFDTKFIYFSDDTCDNIIQSYQALLNSTADTKHIDSINRNLNVPEVIKSDLDFNIQNEHQSSKEEKKLEDDLQQSEELDVSKVISRFGHLLVHSQEEPFKFSLKISHSDTLLLKFEHLEILVRNELEYKKPNLIDALYLNNINPKVSKNNLALLPNFQQRFVYNSSKKWWLIDSMLLLRQLGDCLSKRGYRERALSKSLTKLFEEINNSYGSFVSSSSVADESSNSPGHNSTCASQPAIINNPSTNNLSTSQRCISFRPKIFEKAFKFFKDFQNSRKILQDELDKSDCKDDKNASNNISFCDLKRCQQQLYKDQLKLLKQIYSLEDKVFNANLQQSSVSNQTNHSLNGFGNELNAEIVIQSPLEIAKSRLLDLERRIERRYLRYPFAPRKKLKSLRPTQQQQLLKTINAKLSSNTKSENDVSIIYSEAINQMKKNNNSLNRSNSKVDNLTSRGDNEESRDLERWRHLVQICKTTSKLSLLTSELSKHILWEKSIMKVICQICNQDDDEHELLLCDNCDAGFHTYCFRPTIDS